MKKTIVITLALFILMGGFVFLLLKKQAAEKEAGKSLSFRKFLGFETKLTTPGDQNNLGTTDGNTQSALPTGDTITNNAASWVSKMFGGNGIDGKTCSNGASNPPLCNTFGIGNGNPIISTFTGSPINPNTGGGNGGGSGSGIIIIPTPINPKPIGSGGNGGGGSGSGNGNGPICSTTDSVIAFTPEEQAELQDLQDQFDALAPTLFNSDDVASIQSDYDSFDLGNQKVLELKDYFEIQAPKLAGEYAVRVSTPFYSQVGDSVSFTGASKLDSNFAYNPFYNPAYPTDPNQQKTRNDSLIEKLFQVNIW